MRKTISVFGAALMLPTLCTTVQAQEEDLALEEVIVTASRREERLQDVALSVSAFSSDFFRDAGVYQLTGLEQYTPSLKITPGADSRSTSIRIRGIGSVGTNTGIDPSVGVFIDGIYQGRAGMSIADLVDVQRVEVLRGPQGSLYGKNTAAGAISVITKMPTEEFETMLELNYDSNQRAEVRGMLNLPLGDSGHAMRLSAYSVDGDHLFDNTWDGGEVNDASKWGARSRFLFDMSGQGDDEGLGQFILGMDYTKEDTDCCAFAVITYEGLSTLNAPLTDNPSAALQQELGLNAASQYILQYNAFEETEGYSPPKADPFGDDYWYDGELYNKVEVGGVSLEWNRDLANESSITFLNAWRTYESDSAYDGDFTAYDAVQGSTDIDLDQYSSELRLASAGGETFDYQVGLYAYYSELDSVGTFAMSESLVDNIGLGFFFPDGSLNTDTNTYTTTSYAVFGQVVWSITDEFSATLGARYTWEKKERDGSQITTPTFAFDAPPVAGPDLFYDESRTDSNVSPTLNLRYFFHPDIMGYVSASQGFKSGGYNQRREVSQSNGEFDEETSTTYEMGWKTSWGNRRLQFNGALFYVDYDDFQAQAFDGSSIRVTNAGDLESYGSELELLFIPMANMTLGTAIGYNKAEYDSFDNGQCTVEQTFYQYYVLEGAQGGSPGTASLCLQDLAGEDLDNAPEWTVSSYVQYEKDLFDDKFTGVIRLEHSYIDSFYLDQDLDENLKNDAVDIVNLRLSLYSPDRKWEVALWGRNLLDEEYYGFGIDIPTVGGYAGVVAPDAHYGITLRYTR
jgi:iron complex outermembrane receptor protein